MKGIFRLNVKISAGKHLKETQSILFLYWWCFIFSLNTNACILWKLLNSLLGLNHQARLHNPGINRRIAVPTTPTCCNLQGHHQKNSLDFHPVGISNIWSISFFWVNTERENHIHIFTERTVYSVSHPFPIQYHKKEMDPLEKKLKFFFCNKYFYRECLQRHLRQNTPWSCLKLKETLRYTSPPPVKVQSAPGSSQMNEYIC